MKTRRKYNLKRKTTRKYNLRKGKITRRNTNKKRKTMRRNTNKKRTRRKRSKKKKGGNPLFIGLGASAGAIVLGGLGYNIYKSRKTRPRENTNDNPQQNQQQDTYEDEYDEAWGIADEAKERNKSLVAASKERNKSLVAPPSPPRSIYEDDDTEEATRQKGAPIKVAPNLAAQQQQEQARVAAAIKLRTKILNETNLDESDKILLKGIKEKVQKKSLKTYENDVLDAYEYMGGVEDK